MREIFKWWFFILLWFFAVFKMFLWCMLSHLILTIRLEIPTHMICLLQMMKQWPRRVNCVPNVTQLIDPETRLKFRHFDSNLSWEGGKRECCPMLPDLQHDEKPLKRKIKQCHTSFYLQVSWLRRLSPIPCKAILRVLDRPSAPNKMFSTNSLSFVIPLPKVIWVCR